MDIKAPDKQTVNSVQGYLQTAKLISKTMGHNSITRMAQNSILQFPLLMSAGVSTEEASTIAKAFERQYASMMITVFSLNPAIDLNKFDNIGEYIKKYHNNGDIPSDIKAAVTSVTTESAAILDSSDPMLNDVAVACWGASNEALNPSILNNNYLPYKTTYRKLSNALESMQQAKAAKEASITDIKKDVKDIGTKLYDANKNPQQLAQNDQFGGLNPGRNGATVDMKNFATIVRNDKLTALEPTLIQIPFVLHGGQGNNTQFTQNVVLGIKMMIRSITSDIMVSNMCEAVHSSHHIFKFIKWVKGECKFVRDFILGIDEIKQDAIDQYSAGPSRFFAAIKRRKHINNISKFFHNPLLPTTTIVITALEAARIKELTGIDLSDARNAMALISKYYILGFAIYDTELKSLAVIFDGETEYSEASIDYLASSNKKDVNLANAKDMLKLMGRI
jgi:hypothetical protein